MQVTLMCSPALKQAIVMNRVFDPWIGDLFEQGINGKKILVVGESHHGGEGCHYPEFTNETIRKEALGLHGHPKRAYFTKVMKLILGVDCSTDDASRLDFWRRISFYNFVQVALDQPRQRPTDQQWETGVAPLQRTLRELKPQYIVILGFDLLKWMPKSLPCSSRATMHPSAYGFTYGDTPDLIQADLQAIKS